VITGHDQRFVGALLFPNLAACRALGGNAGDEVTPAELLALPIVRDRLRARLDEYNYQNPGSSTRVARVLLLADPASIDGGEITDKGYINQRAVLTRRAALVERIHAPLADAADPDVILLIEG
jgi:feruloyl-CoA synthase